MKKLFTFLALIILFQYSDAQTGTVAIAPATTVCTGSNVTLTANGFAGTTISKWQSSSDNATWSNISSSASATLILNNVNSTLFYRAIATTGLEPTNSALLTVDDASSGTISSSASVCSGINSGTLTLTGTFTSVAEWDSSSDGGVTWNPIVNSTTYQNYFNLTATTLYRANVTNNTCAAANATPATITVNPPSFGGNTFGADTVCAGSNSGTLILSSYTGNIIRWQSSTDGGITWSTIANTTNTNNYSNITQTTNYRAVVQSGTCAADNSTSTTINVLPVSDGGTLAPANYSACSGINSGTIVLSGQYGTILNWEFSIDGGITWTQIVNTTPAQNFQNLIVTTKYRAVVQSGNCAAARSAISTVNVSPATIGGTITGSDTVCIGSNSGSLMLNGFTGSVLNWEKSVDGGVTWTNISNTTSIQNFTNLSATTMYRAVIQSGSCSTANSSPATIFVSPISVGGNVLSSKSVCSGTNSGTLTLSGNTGSVIRWEYSTNGGNTWIPIADLTNTYSFTNLTVQTMYRAVVQSGACSLATSQPATVSIGLPPVASFSANTNGPTVIFTNTSSSTNGWSNWDFGDATTSPVTSPAHTYTANGTYSVTLVITDSCGTDITSQTVIITGVGINELAYNNPDVIIYPNPFSETATVNINGQLKPNNAEFIMYDVYGREVKKILIVGYPFSIHRSNLAGGIYFYKLISADEIISAGKIVVHQQK